MSNIDHDPDLKRLSEDIAFVRKTIRDKYPILRHLMHVEDYITIALVTGVALTILPMIWQVVTWSAGGTSTELNLGLWALGLVALTWGGIDKWIVIRRRMKQKNPSWNLFKPLRELYSGVFLHIVVPLAGGVIAAGALLASRHHAEYLIPMSCILYSVVSNGMGHVLQEKPLVVCGYVMSALSIGSLFYVEASPALAVSTTWGLGVLFLGFEGVFVRRGQTSKKSREAQD